MNEKIYYSVTIEYNAGAEVCFYTLKNLTPGYLKKFREDIFICGVYRVIDKDTGQIICPFQIRNIMVYRQAFFFGDADLKKPMTNPNSSVIPKHG